MASRSKRSRYRRCARWAAVPVVVAAAAAAAGCGDGAESPEPEEPEPPSAVACTRASCAGRALVRLRDMPPAAAAVRACVDGRCAGRRNATSRLAVPMPPVGRSGGPSTRTADVTVTVRDRAGELLVRRTSPIRLEVLRPNGRRCTPICWSGEVTIDVGAGAADDP